jgi:hypothetical protein
MDWQEEHKHRVAAFPDHIRTAHKHSSNHREEIVASEVCGCFYCLRTFSPSEIQDWVDELPDGSADIADVGQTALCPHCGIDSVIGSHSGIALTPEFLREMHRYWFD